MTRRELLGRLVADADAELARPDLEPWRRAGLRARRDALADALARDDETRAGDDGQGDDDG